MHAETKDPICVVLYIQPYIYAEVALKGSSMEAGASSTRIHIIESGRSSSRIANTIYILL